MAKGQINTSEKQWILNCISEVVSARIVKGILEVEMTGLCDKLDIGVRLRKGMVFKFQVWLIRWNIMVFVKELCMGSILEVVIITSVFMSLSLSIS